MGQLEGGGTARGTECRTERVAHGGERAHTGSCADGLAACMPCGASSCTFQLFQPSKVLLLTAHILRLPTKDINKEKFTLL